MRLVELQHVSLAIGNDDGFEDRLQDGVGELKLHLAAAGFSVAQFAEPDGKPVEFGGNHSEVVSAAPIHSMFQVALGDTARVAG